MNKKQIMNERIYRHGVELKSFFDIDIETSGVQLCKNLFRIENKLHTWSEKICNGDINPSDEQIEKVIKKAIKDVESLLSNNAKGKIFINTDPRGYAIKIKEEYSKDFYFKDWGGYGIIAPDFKN